MCWSLPNSVRPVALDEGPALPNVRAVAKVGNNTIIIIKKKLKNSKKKGMSLEIKIRHEE